MKKRNVLKASAKSVLCFTPFGSSMYVRSRPSQASRYCGDNAHQHPGRARALTPPLGDATGRPRVPRISLHRRVGHGGQLLFVSFASFCWSGTMSPSNGRTQAIPRRHGRLSPSLARRVSPPPSGPTSASPALAAFCIRLPLCRESRAVLGRRPWPFLRMGSAGHTRAWVNALLTAAIQTSSSGSDIMLEPAIVNFLPNGNKVSMRASLFPWLLSHIQACRLPERLAKEDVSPALARKPVVTSKTSRAQYTSARKPCAPGCEQGEREVCDI